MYSDVPKCLKCCFCLPLRYSLAVWGYLKLIVSLHFLGITFYKTVSSFNYYVSNEQFNEFNLIGPFLTVILLDTFFDLVLIFAAHKKHVKLFQWYYHYSLVILVLLLIVASLIIGYNIMLMLVENDALLFLSFTVENTLVGLGMYMMQIYITLLVRTELMKLQDNSISKFVNNATEQQCTVNVGTNPQLEPTEDALSPE